MGAFRINGDRGLFVINTSLQASDSKSGTHSRFKSFLVSSSSVRQIHSGRHRNAGTNRNISASPLQKGLRPPAGFRMMGST